MITISAEDVKDITLLSVEEAEKLPKKILEFPCWWWLSSQGFYSSFSAIVCDDGYVHRFGDCVDDRFYGVRPALTIKNLKPYNPKVGDAVEVFNEEWYYVGNDMILAKTLDLNKDKSIPFYSGEDWRDFWYYHNSDDSDVYKLSKDWLEAKKNKSNMPTYTMSSSYIEVNDNPIKGVHIDINDISIGDYVAIIDEDPFGEYQLHLGKMSYDLISHYVEGKIFTDLTKAAQKLNELNVKRSKSKEHGPVSK